MADHVVQLEHPITVDGRAVNQVTVRVPRVKDLRLVEKLAGTDRSIRLAAELTALPQSAIEELATGDFDAIHEAISSLGKFQRSGGT